MKNVLQLLVQNLIENKFRTKQVIIHPRQMKKEKRKYTGFILKIFLSKDSKHTKENLCIRGLLDNGKIEKIYHKRRDFVKAAKDNGILN